MSGPLGPGTAGRQLQEPGRQTRVKLPSGRYRAAEAQRQRGRRRPLAAARLRGRVNSALRKRRKKSGHFPKGQPQPLSSNSPRVSWVWRLNTSLLTENAGMRLPLVYWSLRTEEVGLVARSRQALLSAATWFSSLLTNVRGLLGQFLVFGFYFLGFFFFPRGNYST